MDNIKENEYYKKAMSLLNDLEKFNNFYKYGNISIDDDIKVNGLDIYSKLFEDSLTESLMAKNNVNVLDVNFRKSKSVDIEELNIFNDSLFGNIKVKPNKFILYEKDSFFSRHRDAYSPEYNGTVVLCLSDDYEGSILSVECGTQIKEFKLKKGDWVFFYTCCFHKVSKLIEGQRKVITFNANYNDNEILENIQAKKVIRELFLSIHELLKIDESINVPLFFNYTSFKKDSNAIDYELIGIDKLLKDVLEDNINNNKYEIIPTINGGQRMLGKYIIVDGEKKYLTGYEVTDNNIKDFGSYLTNDDLEYKNCEYRINEDDEDDDLAYFENKESGYFGTHAGINPLKYNVKTIKGTVGFDFEYDEDDCDEFDNYEGIVLLDFKSINDWEKGEQSGDTTSTAFFFNYNKSFLLIKERYDYEEEIMVKPAKRN